MRRLDTPFIPATIIDPSALIFRILIHSFTSKLADSSMVPPSRMVRKKTINTYQVLRKESTGTLLGTSTFEYLKVYALCQPSRAETTFP